MTAAVSDGRYSTAYLLLRIFEVPLRVPIEGYQ
jgi:hypothetical protein